MALGLPKDFRFDIFARDRTQAAWRGITNSIRGGQQAVTGFVRAWGPLLGITGVAGLGIIVRQSLEAADSLQTAADRVGVNVERLQELRYAAQTYANVEGNALDMALQRFSRRVGEAANGSGELYNDLVRLGIPLRDNEGLVRDSYEILLDYADAIARAEGPQEQLRLAFKAFDSEGAALVNIMREGRDGVAAYAEEARNLNLVLGEQSVAAAQRANQRLQQLGRSIQTQVTGAVIELAPEIEDLTQSIIDMLPTLIEWATAAANAIGGVLDAISRTRAEQAEALQTFANDVELLNRDVSVREVHTLFRQNFDGAEAQRLMQQANELFFDNRLYNDPDRLDQRGIQLLTEWLLRLADARREAADALTGETPPGRTPPLVPPGSGGGSRGGGGADTPAPVFNDEAFRNARVFVRELEIIRRELGNGAEGLASYTEAVNDAVARVTELEDQRALMDARREAGATTEAEHTRQVEANNEALEEARSRIAALAALTPEVEALKAELEQLDPSADKAAQGFDQLQNAADKAGETIANVLGRSLEDLLLDAERAPDILRALVRELLRVLVVQRLVGGLLGGLGIKGYGNDVTGGFIADAAGIAGPAGSAIEGIVKAGTAASPMTAGAGMAQVVIQQSVTVDARGAVNADEVQRRVDIGMNEATARAVATAEKRLPGQIRMLKRDLRMP